MDMRMYSRLLRWTYILWVAFSVVMSTTTNSALAQALSSSVKLPPPLRQLPTKLLIGYGHNCDHVRTAVHDGVNLVIWVFMNIVAACDIEADERTKLESTEARRLHEMKESKATIRTDLDLDKIGQLIKELDEDGYSDVVHMVSFGGWNGPHLDPNLSAQDWYAGWKDSAASKIFHGIDWDLEGNDDLDSPYNYFTKECLDKMGHISRYMKEGTYC